MNKEESTVDEFDEDSVEDNTESDESSVPLSQFEKIKDDYLRPVSYTHLTLPTSDLV